MSSRFFISSRLLRFCIQLHVCFVRLPRKSNGTVAFCDTVCYDVTFESVDKILKCELSNEGY